MTQNPLQLQQVISTLLNKLENKSVSPKEASKVARFLLNKIAEKKPNES